MWNGATETGTKHEDSATREKGSALTGNTQRCYSESLWDGCDCHSEFLWKRTNSLHCIPALWGLFRIERKSEIAQGRGKTHNSELLWQPKFSSLWRLLCTCQQLLQRTLQDAAEAGWAVFAPALLEVVRSARGCSSFPPQARAVARQPPDVSTQQGKRTHSRGWMSPDSSRGKNDRSMSVRTLPWLTHILPLDTPPSTLHSLTLNKMTYRFFRSIWH